MRLMLFKDGYFLSVITLIKIVSWFSSPRLKEWVVRCIAFVAYHLSNNKRQLSQKNLVAAFDGKLSESQVRRVVKQAFYEFWSDMFSFPLSRTERATRRHAQLCGVEHLSTALKNGKGVILWESSYLGGRIVAKQILHEQGFALYQVHGPRYLGGFDDSGLASWVRYRIVNPFFDKCERQFVREILYLPRSDSLVFTRVLLQQLKQNAIVCISGDHGAGQKLIPIKFLGRTSFFSPGMVSLARIAGAVILPMFCIRERGNETRIVIESPIRLECEADKEGLLEKSITQYVSLLESYIRRYPEQYRNWQGERSDDFITIC